MLTDRFIKNAKPGTYADEGGLYLRVLSKTKAFVWRRRVDGKDVWETLGHYPALGLADARDLLEKRKTGRQLRTVREAYNEYYQYLEKEFVRPEQVDRIFRRDVLPGIENADISELTRTDWVDIVQKIVDRGSPVMANRTLTQVKKFLDYADQRGWIDENPIDRVKRKTVGGKETAKDRNLSWGEIADFFKLITDTTNNLAPGTRWALLGCLLTGQRASEVLSLQPDGSTFTKMQRNHRVPVTPHVRLWLGKKPDDPPRDHRVMSHALRRLEQTFTPHDLRRTFASRLADLGVAPHIIEKLLDHKMTGVMAIYNHAEYWPERHDAMRLWGRELAKKFPRS